MVLGAAIASQPVPMERRVLASEVGLIVMGAIVDTANPVILLKLKKNDQVAAFRVGAVLFQKYTIEEIASDFFNVSYLLSGNRVKQSVYRDDFAGAIGKSQTITAEGDAPTFTDSFQEEGFERDGEHITMSEAYKEKLIKKDLHKILMQASAEPVLKDGNIAGFALDQIDPASIFAKAGIRDGDVIRSINGIALHDVTSTIKLLQSLRGSKDLKIDLERAGSAVGLVIEVK
jgi:hypothetical protein